MKRSEQFIMQALKREGVRRSFGDFGNSFFNLEFFRFGRS